MAKRNSGSVRKVRLLVNLPPTFFSLAEFAGTWRRLGRIATLRRRSHDTAEQVAPDLGWAEAVIMWAWPALTDELLRGAPNLRFVGQINGTRRTARACFARKIALSEARHCWSNAVAELALALILDGLRKTTAYHAAMRAGSEHWVHQFPADIDPLERELTGQSVGIVGFGGIGRRLAELLAPFRTDLRAFDPFVPARVLAAHGARAAPLSELVRRSTVVVLCAANTPENQHLIGARQIARLRPNAVVVNVGRSMLVDMQALAARLERGDLIAMLDVFAREPLEPDSPLRRLPNTHLTPHRAGGVLASVARALEMLTSDLEAHVKGKKRRYSLVPAMLSSLPD